MIIIKNTIITMKYSYDFLKKVYEENRHRKYNDLTDYSCQLAALYINTNIEKLLCKKNINEFDLIIKYFELNSSKLNKLIENKSNKPNNLPIYIDVLLEILEIINDVTITQNISINVLKLIEFKLKFLNEIKINKQYNFLWTFLISRIKTFKLSYFGYNLKNIHMLIHKLKVKYIYDTYQKIQKVNYFDKLQKKQKFKIGVVNEYLLGNHVMSKWYLPIFNMLDKNLYNIIYITSKASIIETNISHNFDKIIQIPCINYIIADKYKDNSGINDLINEQFDIIIYPSIGMSILSNLSHIRLAPLQIMFPGHPITSGSKHIDYILLPNYFVKNDLEKNLLQESLSEQIIYYDNNHIINNHIKLKQKIKREDLFMRDDVFYITCFQNKWKITNYMKQLIENILNNTPNNIHIILQESLTEKIQNKSTTCLLKNKYPNRILIIDTQLYQVYLNLINNTDLILDSYPFNGSTTTLEALTLGKIVIGMDINNDSNTDVYIPSACLNSFYNILQINGLTYKTQKELINAINVLYKNKNEKLRIENLINKSKYRFNINPPDLNILFRHLHLINKPRIFNVSCNKTGTTSLEHLFVKSFNFNKFDENAIFYKNDNLVNDILIKQDYTSFLKIIEESPCNFFSDLPFNFRNTYKILDKTYPKSKFILCIRDTDKWINSLKKWMMYIKPFIAPEARHCINMWVKTAFPKTMNENWEIINEYLLAHLYEKHNNDIIEYFKGTNKLLVYKLEESSKSKIEKICDFIQIKNNNYMFPTQNKLN